ncbi:MAG: phosphatidylglycerol lysyltransferase domain-containing protein [Bacteroidales bacterium]|nr:phosphatidylglycerol lysyltransferase domain-containing protein [Anaerotignum sp.]MCI5679541.1 phosphatidylglycerol lysyltransferase domain-containing protein [Bacteroidales bacterium]MDY3927000.1 phosphatidylglycerol lysyltransferase domain-containing protein [Anaerotignum sp.]
MPRCLECEKNKIENNTAELVFKPITLDIKKTIDSYTKPWKLECSDLSFANLFIWGADGKMEYAEKDKVLYIKLDFEGVPVFLWAPIPMYGAEVDYRKAIYDGIEYMRSIGIEPTFRSVWTPFRDKMLEACPELFSVPTDIAWDYVYSRESLATLKGKKLHGKRNHINKFLSKYPDFEYRKLDKSMIEDCIALYDQWIEEKDEKESKSMEDEKRSVQLALHNMEELGLTGGTIYIDGKLCAFTIGERLHPHIQLIHIEKANTEYEGIFPMINQQYILHECEGVELVNREEDMGIEGMRKAKRSYNPLKMVEKYMLSTRDLTDVKGIWGKEEE